MKRNLNKLILFAIILCTVISVLVACSAVEFKLEFIVDGKVYATINTNGKEVIEMPDDPTKEGYVFDGWYYDEGIWEKPFTANSLLDTPLSESMKVYAKWNEEYCTITYNLNGGQNNSENPSGYIPGNEIILQAPTKLGYTFLGWYSDSNFNTKVTQIASESTGNIELWAKWEAIEYTIIYNLGGGINNSNNPSSYTIGNGEIILEDPSKRGYFFDGWYNANGERVYFINPNDLKEIELFARWKLEEYTITYELNGGINSDLNIFKYDILSNTIILHNPTKTECTFEGWYTTAEFLPESKVYEIKSGSVGDIVVYAKWLEYRIESAPGYEIDYSQSTPKVSRVVANNVVNIDLNSSINVSPNCTWKLYADFIGNNEYKLKAMTLEVGNNIAYIIVYHPDGEHFLRYELNLYRLDIKEYTFLDDSNIFKKGTIEETSAINSPSKPRKTGYDFVCWMVDGIDVTFPYQVNKDTIFVAKYMPITYKINYKLNGGTIENAITEYNIETDVEFKEPSKKHYVFDGWYLYEDFSGQRVGNTGLGCYWDINVYAKWIPYNYSINYELNGGYNNSFNPTEYNIETPTFDLGEPLRRGYTFAGWYSDESFVNEYNTIILGTTGDKIVYAKWEANENILHFNGNGSTSGEMTDMVIKSDHTDILSNNLFEREYYTFIGWSTTPTGEVEYENNDEYLMGLDSEYTLYAVWEANENILHFNGNGSTSGEMTDMVIKSDHTDILSNNLFEREYYTFIGWSTTPTGEVEYENNDEYLMGLDSEYTLYAVWQAIEYTITYDLNNGQNNISNPTKFTVEDLPVDLYNPTKENYVFNDWYISSQYSEPIYQITECGNITLYAEFIKYTKGLEFTLSSDGTYYNVSDYTGDSEKVVFIEKYNNKPIKGIDTSAFEDCTYITSITIPDSVTSIGEGAFSGCSGLTDVYYEGDIAGWCNISFESDSSNPMYYADNLYINGELLQGELILPNSVTGIGDYAFYNCTSLTSIEIPSSVTSIGISAFSGCSGLTDVYYEGDIAGWCNISFESDSSNPMYYADNLYINGEIISGEIVLGNNITIIPSYTFKNSNITSITIPDSVTSIGEGAFTGCSSLESITLPFIGAKAGVTLSDTNQYPLGYIFGTTSYTGGVATEQSYCGSSTSSTTSTTYYIPATLKSVIVTGGNILYGAFYNCSSLTSIEIPDSVTGIGDYAFYNCTSLTGIEIPSSVTSIGISAFDNCISLTSITIPEGVTSIGEYTFYNCTSLTSIEIPSSVTSIGRSAFSGCSGLTSIEIPNSVTSIGSYAFSRCSSLTSITIPEGVTSIGEYAFYNCSSLTTITIGNGVTSIGDYAFDNCISLTSITIPEGVTRIGRRAFYDCSSLTTITIGNGVTSIGGEAFYDCSSLTSIIIGNGVTSIGSYAFSVCSGLTDVYYEGDIAGWCNISFEGYNSNPMRYADNLYINGELLQGELIIPNSVTGIGDYAFYNCTSLTSIEIPNSMTSIGSSAFSDCSSLTTITIGNGVTSIGGEAFYDCSSLTSIIIGNGVTSIGSYAFSVCSGLTDVYYEGDIAGWCNISFEGYNSNPMRYADNLYINGELLQGELIIPNSVTGIGDYAFYNCSSLTSIEIPNSVTSIGDYAFYNCTSLTGIEIPSSVTSIGDYAFYNCTSLTSIKIPNSVASIGKYAFSRCKSLISVAFDNPNNWQVSTNRDFLGYTSLSNSSLSNASTATDYLKSTYSSYYWRRVA